MALPLQTMKSLDHPHFPPICHCSRCQTIQAQRAKTFFLSVVLAALWLGILIYHILT